MQINAIHIRGLALQRAVLASAVVLLLSTACASGVSEVESPTVVEDDVAALQARLDALEERLAEQGDSSSSEAAQSMMDEMRGTTDAMGTMMEEMGPENMDPTTMGDMQSMMGQMEAMAAQMGGMGMGDMMSGGQSMQKMVDHMHAMHGDLDQHAEENHQH